MIRILKSPIPSALSRYRKQCKEQLNHGSTNVLDDYPQKVALRKQLAKEQGYLCAYCMRRISLDFQATVIEHVKSQSRYPKEQLDYNNLLLCCDGKENGIGSQDHCDESMKDDDIKYDPATHPCIETTIRYRRNGQIFSDDPQWDSDLNAVLNLNAKRLCNNRKAVWEGIHGWLAHDHGRRTRSQIEAKLASMYSRDQQERLPEYCGVMVYVLQKHPSYLSR